MIFRVLFLALVFFVSHARANDMHSPELHAVNAFIYNFKFNSADSLLKILEKKEPNDPEIKLGRANYLWWMRISGDTDITRENEYIRLLDDALRLTTERKPIDNRRLMILINIYSFKARINGLNKNYIKAFNNVNNCIDHLKTSFGKETQFEFFYLTSGLYNYYISQAPKDYPILIPYLVLLPSGDKSKGIDHIKRCTKAQDTDLRTEGNYFLMKIYLEQKNYETALSYADVLVKKYPGNLLYRYYRFKSLLNNDRKDEAIEELSRIRIFAYSNSCLQDFQKKHFLNQAQVDLTNYYSHKKQ